MRRIICIYTMERFRFGDSADSVNKRRQARCETWHHADMEVLVVTGCCSTISSSLWLEASACQVTLRSYLPY